MQLSTPAPRPATSAADSPSGGCSLAVHVDGFRNRKGVVGCAVFRTPNGWPEHDELAAVRAAQPIKGNSATVTFAQVPPGRYAIAVLHDENENHHLDRNVFRVPKEGFGFANNPKVAFSAPSWEEAAVQVGCPATTVDVHLIYK